MDTQTLMVLMDAFPVITLFIYGFKFKFKTPAFGDMSGLRSAYTQASREAWDYAHRFAGTLCIIASTIEGIVVIYKYSTYGYDSPIWIEFTIIGVALVFVFTLIPITNLRLKALYGEVKKPGKGKKK